MKQRVLSSVQRVARRYGIYLVRNPPPESHDRILRDTLHRLDITHVLDVGGHTGEFGSRIRKLGFRGQILSFEPVPESFSVLSETAARDGRWRVFPFAVGRTNMSASLNVARNDVFSSLLEAAPDAAAVTNQMIAPVREITVPVRTLESLWSAPLNLECAARVFLKTDTQGFDMEVIAGVGNRLHQIAALQLELPFVPLYNEMPTLGEAIKTLADLGYAVHSITPAARAGSGQIVEVDVLLVQQLRWP